MPLPAYSRELLQFNIGPSGSASATVPADKTWVVRDIDAMIVGLDQFELELSFQFGSIVPMHIVLPAQTSASYSFRGRQVLPGSQTLTVTLSSIAGNVQGRISGYELSAV